MPINDTASGLVAAFGMLVALIERERSGLGQHVETSLAAQSVLFQSRELTRFRGAQPPPAGGRDFLGSSELGRVVECADGWLAVAAGTSVNSALEAIGAREAGASWDSVAMACTALSREEALVQFHAAGVTAAPALRLEDVFEHPWHRENGLFVEYDDPSYGHVTAVRGYAKFGDFECGFPRRTPMCGEHSVEVLLQFGIDASRINGFLSQGVVALSGKQE